MGLSPTSVPERVAQRKLVEELLDQAIAQGFLGIGHLRDALSRNQLKLKALSGPGELLFGDALLHADRLLSLSLDGVYRGGEIYLRLLQKLSSLAFGTRPGRDSSCSISACPSAPPSCCSRASRTSSGPSRITSVTGTSPAHLAGLPRHGRANPRPRAQRGHPRRRLDRAPAIGAIFRAIFVPTSPAGSPASRCSRAWSSRPLRLLARYGCKPLVPAALLLLVAPLRHAARPVMVAVVIGAFLLANLLMNSRAGSVAEEVALDWSARKWRFVSRRVLPGLFHLIVDVFKAVLEGLERGIHRIDEWLRFRQGESAVALALKGAFGALWFFVAYLVRIYINLLIEPQINPIKHFPVVTVAAKILVPMSPGLIRGLNASLAPVLGQVAAATIAGPTVLLLPGFFGFLIWELKENWKLYRQSRPASLGPVPMGHHGETMGALMKPASTGAPCPSCMRSCAARRARERRPSASTRSCCARSRRACGASSMASSSRCSPRPRASARARW